MLPHSIFSATAAHTDAGVPSWRSSSLRAVAADDLPNAGRGPQHTSLRVQPSQGAVLFGSYVDELLSYTNNGTRYFTHSNHLYSPSAVTNAAGQVQERYSYNAYGKQAITSAAGVVRARSSVGFDRGFTGYILDEETGLYYARARMYSSGLGRFVGRDPNQYVDGYLLYCAYFIPNEVDPTGEHAWSPQLDDGFNNNPAGLSDGIVGYDMRIKYTVPANIPYTPVRVLQVNHIKWIGLSSTCEIKSGEDYIMDLPGTFAAGAKVLDHLSFSTEEKYCAYYRVIEKTIGTGEKGKSFSGIGNDEAGYGFVKARMKEPIATLVYSYIYTNPDNCKCCPLAERSLGKFEGISMPGVGSWSGTF